MVPSARDRDAERIRKARMARLAVDRPRDTVAGERQDARHPVRVERRVVLRQPAIAILEDDGRGNRQRERESERERCSERTSG